MLFKFVALIFLDCYLQIFLQLILFATNICFIFLLHSEWMNRLERFSWNGNDAAIFRQRTTVVAATAATKKLFFFLSHWFQILVTAQTKRKRFHLKPSKVFAFIHYLKQGMLELSYWIATVVAVFPLLLLLLPAFIHLTGSSIYIKLSTTRTFYYPHFATHTHTLQHFSRTLLLLFSPSLLTDSISHWVKESWRGELEWERVQQTMLPVGQFSRKG